MSPRRITLTVGTATGGLLAAAFLPMAVAFADTFAYEPDPNSAETVFAPVGIPPFFEGISGTQPWDVNDTTNTASNPVATFFGEESNLATVFGISNTQVVVTNDLPNGLGQIPSEDPPANSVFDWTYFGNPSTTDFYNFYSDIAGTNGAADTVTDTLVTPFGAFNIPIDFDVSALFSF